MSDTRNQETGPDHAPELETVEARQGERRRGMPLVLVISTLVAALLLFALVGVMAGILG